MQQWDLRTLEVRAHRPEVLETSDEGRTILLLRPAGESLQEHQVHERAWLLVIEGEVEIEQDGDVVQAGPGRLAVFSPKQLHEVRARSDARLLLILAPWPGEGHPSQHAGSAS